MIKNDLRLLIHHHHPVYVDEKGDIWCSSVIGRWLDSISSHINTIGLLLYESKNHLPQLDTPINKKHVKFYSLGLRKPFIERVFSLSNFRNMCRIAGMNSDILLIRGPTPHQFIVWCFTPIKNKAFFLVGRINSVERGHLTLKKYIYSHFLYLIRKFQIRLIIKKSSLVLANSPELVSELEKLFNVKCIFVPTNSLREIEYPPLKINNISDTIKILYVGRLDFRKGIFELFKAIQILNKAGHSTKLDLIGNIDEKNFSAFVDLSKKLAIEEHINWHGFVSYGPDLQKKYLLADIFVLPSYTEGFPHVIWEAMANSCPVITTNVGGIPYILKNEENALLINPKSAVEIVNSILKLRNNECLKNKIVENAYELSRKFSAEKCSQIFLDVLYEQFHKNG